jgi:CRISPR-associated exonuclease Cas4
MINVNDVVQYLYCPRKVYFRNVLGLKLKKQKMEFAKELHENLKLEFEECEVLYDVFLESQRYGVKGVVDAIVKCDDYYPIEAKFTRFNEVYYSWKMQIVAYAALIEENFNTVVRKGYIFLIDRKELIELSVSPEDKRALMSIADRVRKLIESEIIPDVEKSKKCNYCEMEKVC